MEEQHCKILSNIHDVVSKVSVPVTSELTKISSNSIALLSELLHNHHNTSGNLSWP